MNKYFNQTKILKLLIVFVAVLGSYQISMAQHSLFNKDTVEFVYYSMDDEDKLRPKQVNYKLKIQGTDTLLDHSIYVDAQKNVYWNTMMHAIGHDGIALDLWNLGLREKGESMQDIINKTSPAEKSYLPVFRTFKKKNKIYYQTIGKNPKVFFTISLSNLDTLNKFPFFMNEGDASQLYKYHMKMTYVGDTTIIVKNTEVLCYRFKSQIIKIKDDMQEFALHYNEVLFEHASLLPILIIERHSDRTYYPPPWPSTGFGLQYDTQVISVR